MGLSESGLVLSMASHDRLGCLFPAHVVVDRIPWVVKRPTSIGVEAPFLLTTTNDVWLVSHVDHGRWKPESPQT